MELAEPAMLRPDVRVSDDALLSQCAVLTRRSPGGRTDKAAGCHWKTACRSIRRMTLRILALAALPLTASAQLLTFGIQGGVPAQTPLGRTDKIPFAVGPSVD